MTALFVVMFVNQWEDTKDHVPALSGLISSAACLFIFGSDSFIVPTMIVIILSFLCRNKVQGKKEQEMELLLADDEKADAKKEEAQG